MTPIDKEFGELLQELHHANDEYEIRLSYLSSKPEYHSRTGLNTPSEMAQYKTLLDQYMTKKKELEEAEQKLTAAQQKLDEWIPAPVQTKLDQGGAIYTPFSDGVAGLFKVEGKYVTSFGVNDQEARNNFLRNNPPRR